VDQQFAGSPTASKSDWFFSRQPGRQLGRGKGLDREYLLLEIYAKFHRNSLIDT